MVSVAIATFNGEKYIKEQIESILINLNPEDEIIVSDDGSLDKTLDIIKLCNDDRIKIVDGPRMGIAKNFENAIRNCSGEFIFLCDQDDVWMPNKVDKMIEALKVNGNVLAIHDTSVVNANKEIIEESYFKYRNGVHTSTINNLVKSSYYGCCMAFRASIISKVLPIPDECLHDWWIGLAASRMGKTAIIHEVLMLHRRHGNNSSSFGHPNNKIKQIKDRVVLLYWLFKRKIW